MAASGAEDQPQRVYIDLDAPGTPASKVAQILREGNYPAVDMSTAPADFDLGEWGPEDWTKEDEGRYLWHGDRFPDRREVRWRQGGRGGLDCRRTSGRCS